jgi:hypothetical protein
VLFNHEPKETNSGFVFDMHLHLHYAPWVCGLDLLAVLTCDEGYVETRKIWRDEYNSDDAYKLIRTFTLKLFMLKRSAEGTYTEIEQIQKDPVKLELDSEEREDEYNV